MSIPSITSYPLPQAGDLPDNKVSWQVMPERAVLLIHDMQDYFLRFYGDGNPLAENLINNTASLIRWARQQGIPVVYTAQPSEQSDTDRALLNDMWGPGLTRADPALRNIAAPLTPQADDTVLVKWRYSAFQRSPLQERMQVWQRDQLLIAGVYAHIGCMTTALDAFMRDIQPFMLADAVADFSHDEHKMALDYVARRCGVVLTLAQLPDFPPPAAAASSPVSRDDLLQRILLLIDEDAGEFDGDELLVDYGLDSVQVMQLIGEWEKLGINVQFEELARHATFNAWWDLISRRQSAGAA